MQKSNKPQEARRRYQEDVPAVRRAAQALQLLAAARTPLSLAALARGLAANPSSLLAVLTTLREFGLVSRSEAHGRYTLGPALAALGAQALQRMAVARTFRTLADRLVEETGETALLWTRHGGSFLLTGALEGSHPLRYVPRLGAGRTEPAFDRAARSAGGARCLEMRLEPDVWMLAAPLVVGASGPEAVVALAGPASRLRGAAGAPAREAFLNAVSAEVGALAPQPAGPSEWEHSGRIGEAELNDFLAGGLVANLSYLSDDGYPATVPLWFVWDGEAFWLVPHPGAEWAEHARRQPRVSLAVSESVPPLRRVLARGQLAVIARPTAGQWTAVQEGLAARYAGFDVVRQTAGGRRARGTLLRLRPQELIAWRGLLRHPRLPDDAPLHGWRHTA